MAVEASRPETTTVQGLRRLLISLKPHRRLVWVAAACSVLNKLFDLAPPILIGMAVDVVVRQQDSFLAQMGVPTVQGQLLVLALLTLFIWGMESLFEYFFRVLWRNLAQTMS